MAESVVLSHAGAPPTEAFLCLYTIYITSIHEVIISTIAIFSSSNSILYNSIATLSVLRGNITKVVIYNIYTQDAIQALFMLMNCN